MKKDTIARTVVLAIALVNQALTLSGRSILPFEEQTVNELVSLGFTIVTSAIAWWKNNSFTKEAIEADRYMHELKEGSKNV